MFGWSWASLWWTARLAPSTARADVRPAPAVAPSRSTVVTPPSGGQGYRSGVATQSRLGAAPSRRSRPPRRSTRCVSPARKGSVSARVRHHDQTDPTASAPFSTDGSGFTSAESTRRGLTSHAGVRSFGARRAIESVGRCRGVCLRSRCWVLRIGDGGTISSGRVPTDATQDLDLRGQSTEAAPVRGWRLPRCAAKCLLARRQKAPWPHLGILHRYSRPADDDGLLHRLDFRG